MEHRKPGRVYRLKFIPPVQPSLLYTPRQQILNAITPGNRTRRYGRTWIVGQTEVQGDVLTGRIGYQGDGTTDLFDEERNDFVEINIPAGTTAPFAINLESLEAAMQARAGTIKIQGLIGAFEALLYEAGDRWKVIGLNRPMTLAAWKESVEKVTVVRVVIKKPNPHYHGAKDLETLMTEMETEVIRLEARNEISGVNVDSAFLQETEAHIERGYGEAEYRGIKGTGSEAHESVYLTGVGLEEEYEEIAVDSKTGEVASSALKAIVGDEEDHDQLTSTVTPPTPEVQNDERGYLEDPFSDD